MPKKQPNKFSGNFKQVINTKNVPLDLSLKAKLPGYRISKSGKQYMETRQNRSDRRGLKI